MLIVTVTIHYLKHFIIFYTVVDFDPFPAVEGKPTVPTRSQVSLQPERVSVQPERVSIQPEPGTTVLESTESKFRPHSGSQNELLSLQL